MRNMKRTMALMLALVMVFSLTMASAVFAGGNSGKESSEPKGKTEIKDKEIKQNALIQSQEANTGDSTQNTEKHKIQIKLEEKSKNEALKMLREQYAAAKKIGNLEEMKKLEEEIDQCKDQLKQLIRDRYTEQERLQLMLMEQQLKAQDPTLAPLPVENIIAKGKDLKFDTPPVIKDGKVLVPVRAFSEAYGAEVLWNQEDHTITIAKGDLVIVLKTDSSTVYVNGVETDLGLPLKAINGRNVIPVGFLAEKLGLKVEVDLEDGTVEVEEEPAAEEASSEEASN